MSLLLVLSCLTIGTSCTKAKPNFALILIGMSENDVIAKLGPPDSIAQIEDTKYLEYESSSDGLLADYHFVRLIAGRVDAYGRKGDFGSSKKPTRDINIKQKVEIEKSEQTNDSTRTGKADLEAELKKYERLKKDGLLTDAEYQLLRQRAINKATGQ